jgi:hypothetical protein
MARADDIGLFWEDLPPVKPPKKEKPKRTPPERTWEHPDYLPGLDEALSFKFDLLTDEELALYRGDEMVWDTECYPNYWLSAFRHIKTGKIIYFEMYEGCPLWISKMEWVLRNFCIVTFNGLHYDEPITTLALAGKTNAVLHFATYQIIEEGLRPGDVLRTMKVKRLKDINQIDLIEVAKGDCSLKIYGGRIHCPRMQDLPFKPGTELSANQMAIVRWYCVNDLINTQLLRETLHEQIALRVTLSREYKMDVRSKSDAQIAEALISQTVAQLNGRRPQVPKIAPGTKYRYTAPACIRYQSQLLNWVLHIVTTSEFEIGDNGSPILPKPIKDLNLEIAGRHYQMGFGGLHSQEECISHFADDTYEICDNDVASFYPQNILNNQWFPLHLGPNFLVAYQAFVTRRLAAKAAGNKPVAESLKIVINGGFGKLGSMYSILYSPDLMIQVTLTGQLLLLMMIERLELIGIPVVSANTDGIVVKCPRTRKHELQAIVKQWECETKLVMEETQYKSIHSANVNNYFAVKLDGTTKTKGWYANPWNDKKNIATRLEKNPTATICTEAVTEMMISGTPVEKTIRMCDDVRKFVSIRTVKGGAVKDGVYLGKAIRWYYSTKASGEIIYALTGNKVSNSDGALPLMNLPDALPVDVDYDWYIRKAESILVDIGLQQVNTTPVAEIPK